VTPRTEAGRELLNRIGWFASEKGDALLEGILAIESEAVGRRVLPAAHESGETHRYRIECEVCGQRGTVRLSVEPERSA
jgi:hypothetical protein